MIIRDYFYKNTKEAYFTKITENYYADLHKNLLKDISKIETVIVISFLLIVALLCMARFLHITSLFGLVVPVPLIGQLVRYRKTALKLVDLVKNFQQKLGLLHGTFDTIFEVKQAAPKTTELQVPANINPFGL